MELGRKAKRSLHLQNNYLKHWEQNISTIPKTKKMTQRSIASTVSKQATVKAKVKAA